MEICNITTEFIKLDQFLKWTGISSSGLDAKILISEGKVEVNGLIELKRGRKLRKGDTVKVGNKILQID